MWRLFSQQGHRHFALLFRERNQRRCAVWRSRHCSRRCQRSSATHVVLARVRTKIRMPQCKAFGCFNEQGKCHNEDRGHKSFFKFPNPTKSKESRKLCAKWLANLKNANLPIHVRDYIWSGAHKVCEDHFTPDCFQGQGAHVTWRCCLSWFQANPHNTPAWGFPHPGGHQQRQHGRCGSTKAACRQVQEQCCGRQTRGTTQEERGSAGKTLVLSQQQFFSSSTTAMSNWHRPPHLHSASSWTSTASSIPRSLSSDSEYSGSKLYGSTPKSIEYSGSKLYGSTPKSIVQVLENTCVSLWVRERERAPEIDRRNVVCSIHSARTPAAGAVPMTSRALPRWQLP